jgi:RNA polymerase sigma-70 factor (ECF subfamily)
MAGGSGRPRRARAAKGDDEGRESLGAAFTSARPDLEATEGLGEALRAALDAARAAWPGVDLSAEAFVRFVAAKLPAGEPPERSLADLHASDLYLACACAEGAPWALAELDRVCLPLIGRASARLGASPEQVLDVRQRVRQRLLAPRPDQGDGPTSARIAGYSGRGPLRAWLRVVAVREAVIFLRQGRNEIAVENDALARELEPDAGPELVYFKRLYREEFKTAFAEAIAKLSDRERTLLRQHALDGLSIDRLAALYQVHRATAARWVEAARRAALEHTRLHFKQRLRLGPDELDSVMRLLQSQFDITLAPLLREHAPPPPAPNGEPPPPGGKRR